MKAKEIRELNAEELNQKLASLKEELFNLRFQHATGQLENPMRIKDVKKSIARIKTIQREAEIKAAVQKEAAEKVETVCRQKGVTAETKEAILAEIFSVTEK